jgi:hypothetical protein
MRTSFISRRVDVTEILKWFNFSPILLKLNTVIPLWLMGHIRAEDGIEGFSFTLS